MAHLRCSVGNVIALIFLLSMPDNTAFLCLSMFLAKMYSNSLLASLNGRISLRSSGAEAHITLSGVYPTITSETAQIHVAMVPHTSAIRYGGSDQDELESRRVDNVFTGKRFIEDSDTV
ncbi:hypothetical protein OF83DRAFT_298304 [Amylostereum chailletii]|nr:hypothetical protein OF83DRAFT_298304 [Amylostereum chailletii]